jgi:hypothetical protein
MFFLDISEDCRSRSLLPHMIKAPGQNHVEGVLGEEGIGRSWRWPPMTAHSAELTQEHHRNSTRLLMTMLSETFATQTDAKATGSTKTQAWSVCLDGFGCRGDTGTLSFWSLSTFELPQDFPFQVYLLSQDALQDNFPSFVLPLLACGFFILPSWS